MFAYFFDDLLYLICKQHAKFACNLYLQKYYIYKLFITFVFVLMYI